MPDRTLKARLPRAHLVERLLRVPSGGLGLIVAPSGYGGSTLLDLVATSCPQIPVRLSLDHMSTGGRGFTELVAAALSQAGFALDGPDGPEVSSPDAVRRALTSSPDVLVLVDDLGSGPEGTLDPGFVEFVTTMPDSVRVVARASRSPRIDVSRLLASGRLILLDRGDLTLGADESESYLKVVAPALAADRRAALIQLAEGWIGALTAAVAGSGGATNTDPGAWLLGSGLELLVGPTVDRLDDQDRDLLIRTSVLENLRPAICADLTGMPDAARRLRALHAAQVLAPVASTEGSGYRVHGLLREYLRRQLAGQGPEVERAAHLAAGRWFASDGDANGAINHLLECGEVVLARQVLEQRVESLLNAGAADAVRGWYRSAPQLAVAPGDLHLLAASWAEVLAGDTATAREHLLALEVQVQDLLGDPEDPRHTAGAAQGGALWLRAETLLLRGYLEAWAGQVTPSLGHIKQVRALYGDAWSRVAHQAAALLEVRLTIWVGDVERAAGLLLAAASRPGTNTYHRRVDIPTLTAQLAAEEGRAQRARILAQEALTALKGMGQLSRVDGCAARLARSRALLDLGELTEAREEAEAVVATSTAAAHLTFEVLARIQRALTLAAALDATGAEDELDRARLAIRGHGAGRELTRWVDLASVELAIEAGDRRLARRRLEILPDSRRQHAMGVRVAGMGGGSHTEADVVNLARTRQPVTPREVVEVRMLMASALAPARATEAAMHLRTAADLAVEHGMLRTLCNRSEVVLTLARQLDAQQDSPALRTLLAQAAHPTPGAPALPQLSSGEHELLAHLASPLGNRELAAELGISLNTLKTRLRRLYAKLGVHDRAAALAFVPASR